MIVSAVVIFTTRDGRQFEIPCHRHADAFWIIKQFIPSEEIDKTMTRQGFLNHEGKYLDRMEARTVAYSCGQVKEVSGLLYSEDLW